MLMKESLDLALCSILTSAGLEQLSGFWEACGGRVQCSVLPAPSTGVSQQGDWHFLVVGNYPLACPSSLILPSHAAEV